MILKLHLTPELDNGLMPTGEPVTKGGGDNSTFRGAVRFVARWSSNIHSGVT